VVKQFFPIQRGYPGGGFYKIKITVTVDRNFKDTKESSKAWIQTLSRLKIYLGSVGYREQNMGTGPGGYTDIIYSPIDESDSFKHLHKYESFLLENISQYIGASVDEINDILVDLLEDGVFVVDVEGVGKFDKTILFSDDIKLSEEFGVYIIKKDLEDCIDPKLHGLQYTFRWRDIHNQIRHLISHLSDKYHYYRISITVEVPIVVNGDTCITTFLHNTDDINNLEVSPKVYEYNNLVFGKIDPEKTPIYHMTVFFKPKSK
jgi:hypothetical protein